MEKIEPAGCARPHGLRNGLDKMFPTASRANAQQVELDDLIRHRVVVSDIDIAMMRKVERFILRYVGDDPLHDIELKFQRCSYRAFFLALRRAQARKAGGA